MSTRSFGDLALAFDVCFGSARCLGLPWLLVRVFGFVVTCHDLVAVLGGVYLNLECETEQVIAKVENNNRQPNFELARTSQERAYF